MNDHYLPHHTAEYWRINELKNFLYCPRISYYTLCLRLDRETGLSRMGIEAEANTKDRMRRRKHALHAVVDGRRHLDVTVTSHDLRLVGKIDEVVETDDGVYLVDYKDTDKDFGYWRVQMCAYQRCAKELWSIPVLGCTIYSIPTQTYHAVKLNKKDNVKLERILEQLSETVNDERFPRPPKTAGKCRVCQYACFCNDVF